MSILNAMGEFEPHDDEADAEARRAKVYASLRAIDAKSAKGRREDARKSCEMCGGRLPPGRSRYCSPECTRSAWRERKLMGHGYADCAECGKVYEKHSSSHKYCSEKCRKAARERRKKERE